MKFIENMEWALVQIILNNDFLKITFIALARFFSPHSFFSVIKNKIVKTT
jgi:hypothetical protein